VTAPPAPGSNDLIKRIGLQEPAPVCSADAAHHDTLVAAAPGLVAGAERFASGRLYAGELVVDRPLEGVVGGEHGGIGERQNLRHDEAA
jgi:hypothetical protein